jgi:hypothetical protein
MVCSQSNRPNGHDVVNDDSGLLHDDPVDHELEDLLPDLKGRLLERPADALAKGLQSLQ